MKLVFTKLKHNDMIGPCLQTCKRTIFGKDNRLVYVLYVRWSLIADDVVAYEYDRLPFRDDTTQTYNLADPADESVEAYATHFLVQLLQLSDALEAFEFNGVELTLKRRTNVSFNVLHELVVDSLGRVLGCEIALISA